MCIAALRAETREVITLGAFSEIAPRESRAGVYVLMCGDVVRYVGHAKNPRARISAHRAAMSFDRVLFCPVDGGRAERQSLEVQTIRALRPTHNNRDNPDKPLGRSSQMHSIKISGDAYNKLMCLKAVTGVSVLRLVSDAVALLVDTKKGGAK